MRQIYPQCFLYVFHQIYDGENTDAQKLGKSFCGTLKPPEVISSSHVVFVRFVTDSSSTYKGFHATYKEIKGE